MLHTHQAVNILQGLVATRHPVSKSVNQAPASQVNSAQDRKANNVKRLKSITRLPPRSSHSSDNMQSTTNDGKVALRGAEPANHHVATMRPVGSSHAHRLVVSREKLLRDGSDFPQIVLSQQATSQQPVQQVRTCGLGSS